MSTTLAEPTIEKLGTTRILTDATPDEFVQGRQAFVRMEPEVGEPFTAVALHSREEAYAVKQLVWMLANREGDGDALRQQITDDIGFETDWSDLHNRFEKVLETY